LLLQQTRERLRDAEDELAQLRARHSPEQQEQQLSPAAAALNAVLDSLRLRPDPALVEALPQLADTLSAGLASSGSHDQDVVPVAWLDAAAELASALGKYAVAARLLEQSAARGGSESAARLAELKQRHPLPGPNEDHETPDSRARFEALEREHAEVLALLANQELDKQVLFGAIRKLGGAHAEESARAQVYLQLRRALA
jgi:hypothetical protein